MPIHELLISDAALGVVSRRLSADPSARLALPAGLAGFGDRRRWLVHDTGPTADPHAPGLVVVASEWAEDLSRRLEDSRDEPAGWGPRVRLALGVGAARGHFAGFVEASHEASPLESLTIVGRGMIRIPPMELPPSAGPWEPAETHSRTIGALGVEVYTRIRSWHVAVIGCGRSGSLAAEALAALGVARLTLIDPDLVEPHNLGEMAGLGPGDVGRDKASAVAGSAGRAAGANGCTFVPVAEPVQSLGSLYALKPADVLVSCPDSPAARLAATILATAYLKPLLDVGTAILPGRDGPRMGLDVRLTLPGRCLACLGGLGRMAEARDALLSGRPARREGDFRGERLGSLRSLNSLGVALGVSLLEQFAAGRVSAPAWIQADLDDQGLPRMTRPTITPHGRCPLCSLTGRGDAGLQDLAEVLRRL